MGKKQEVVFKTSAPVLTKMLNHLAFQNSLHPAIVSILKSGQIILANKAACKLLGYSKKEILTKTETTIFDVSEISFKKMLNQRKVKGHSFAQLTSLTKAAKRILCEITSAVFIDADGIKKSITTIGDLSQSILRQKNIDAIKDKEVANNIVLAKTKQKKIDTKKEKVVADNIVLAKTKQKRIDAKKAKIVAHDIVVALENSDARLAQNNEWLKHIAKTSYDVMWDWNITSGEIYAGDSAEEVFGYPIQNNTVNYIDFMECILPEEKASFEKKLRSTLSATKKSWSDNFMLKRKDGSIASVTSRASIVRNQEGKAIRLIGAIQDVSRVQELEGKLKQQSMQLGDNLERFNEVSKLCFDVIWDWNIETGEVFRGEGFERLLGYPIEENKTDISDWNNHIHPDDKEAVEKEIHDIIISTALNHEYAFRFIKINGTIAYVFNRVRIIRNDLGRACRMIGVLHDISWQKEIEKKFEEEIAAKEKLLAEHDEKFKLIINSSEDVLFDSDLITEKVLISKPYEKKYGYKITSEMTPSDDWLSHIYPDDKAALFSDFTRALNSNDLEWKYSYRFLKADNSVVNVTSNAIIMRDITGKAYRLIGSMHDNSGLQQLEKKLEQEIMLNENRIVEAIEDAKEMERSSIGMELHDNINQLLGASRLYLDMAKRGGPSSKAYLNKSSECTIMVIEEIRKLTMGLTTDTIKNMGLYKSIDALCQDIMKVYPLKIHFREKGFNEASVNDKFKLNIYRIVQEQLNNVLKHAKATRVDLDIVQDKNSIIFTILDNGVGFDTGKKSGGIGVTNIKRRAASFNGTAEFVSKEGQGCILKLNFLNTDALLNN